MLEERWHRMVQFMGQTKNAGLKEHVIPRHMLILQSKYMVLVRPPRCSRRHINEAVGVETEIQSADASAALLPTSNAPHGETAESTSEESEINTEPVPPTLVMRLICWSTKETDHFVKMLESNPEITSRQFNVEWMNAGFVHMTVERFCNKKQILKRSRDKNARDNAAKASIVTEEPQQKKRKSD